MKKMNIPAHLEPFIHWAFNCVAQLWYLFIVVVMAAVVVVVAVVVAFCMRLGGGSRCVRWCCRYSLKVKLVNVTLQKEETLPGLEMRLKPMLTSLGATVEVVSSPQLSFVEVMMGSRTLVDVLTWRCVVMEWRGCVQVVTFMPVSRY